MDRCRVVHVCVPLSTVGRALVQQLNKPRMCGERGAVCHSIVVTRKVKMGDQAANTPDFTILLKGSPESLKIKCVFKITKSITVVDLSETYNIEMLT